MKGRLEVITIICILVSSSIVIGKEDIPIIARKFAENYWNNVTEHHDLESIFDMYGLASREECRKCTLKYGYKVVDVKYEAYDSSQNLYDLIVPVRGTDEIFGFNIFLENRRIGSIEVSRKGDTWEFWCASGSMGKINNFYEVLNSRVTEDEVYYQHYNEPVSFFVKNDSITAIYRFEYSRELGKGIYKEKNIESFIMEEKQRVINRLNVQ